jgi:putative FmdB family regulatory protein
MPFYEYRCQACGHEFEAMQKMSDAPLTDCPECGAAQLTKLISAAGFQLKGGGWYKGGSGDKAADGAGAGHACGSGGCPSCAD